MPTITTRNNGLPFIATGFLALILLGLSGLCFMARINDLSAQNVQKILQTGKKIPVPFIDEAMADKKRSHTFYPFPSFYNDMAFLSYAKGEEETDPAIIAEAYTMAQHWQIKSLQENPADPYGWFRLAYLYSIADGKPSLRIAKVWTQSLAVAPYEPALMLERLRIGMDNYFYLDDQGRSYIPLLIRGLSVFDADALARMAVKKRFVTLAKSVLSDDPAALAYFEKQIARINKIKD